MKTAALLLGCALLAGCTSGTVEVAGPTDPSTGIQRPAGPTPSSTRGPTSPVIPPPNQSGEMPSFVQFGCKSFYAYTTVSASYAQRYLPKGFSSSQHSGNGVSGPAFAIKTWDCPRSVLGKETLGRLAFQVLYLGVVPPARASSPGTAAYWLPLEILANEDDGERALRAVGFGVTKKATLEFLASNADPPALTATGSSPSTESTVQVSSLTTAARPGFKVRYFILPTQGGPSDGDLGWVDIDVFDHAGSAFGISAVAIEGPLDPGGPRWGTPDFQGWSPEERSYVWSPRGSGAPRDGPGASVAQPRGSWPPAWDALSMEERTP